MSSPSLEVDVPAVLVPLLGPSRYKGAHGGRGGAKSHFFAEQLILRCYARKTRAVCIREVQDTIKDSVRQLLIDKIQKFGLGQYFRVLDNEIRAPNGSFIIFRGMQSYNAENIKSLEDFDIAWVEEAQTLSGQSLKLLRPTIRKEGSELWFSWNPRHETDAVDAFFRGPVKYPGAVCVKVGWQDNPWFPDVLRKEMEFDFAADPETAEHVWNGDYERISKGAYFGLEMAAAEREGRICDVPIDPQQPVHTAWDLGKASNNPIWCFQVVPIYREADGKLVFERNEPRIVDFYRPETDDLADWVMWLDQRGYRGNDYVPHDIMVQEWGTKRTRYETLKLMGRRPKRLAMVSVEDGRTAARETIKVAKFDANRCELGVKGLKSYRREWDEELQRFKENPIKDWAEHIGSAFRYLGLAWKDVEPVPVKPKAQPKELVYTAKPDGTVQSNLSIQEAIDAMVKRKRAGR